MPESNRNRLLVLLVALVVLAGGIAAVYLLTRSDAPPAEPVTPVDTAPVAPQTSTHTEPGTGSSIVVPGSRR
jgi:hypothetical protein